MVAPLTAILKKTESSVTSASRVDNNEIVGGRGAVGGGAISQSDPLKKSAKLRSRTKSGHVDNNNNLEEPKFLTSNTKEVFNRLRQDFTKAPIL